MPTYDYECDTCHHGFELRQSFQDEPVGTCPRCQGRASRRFHAVPVIYKGTGFYTTDYARGRGRSSDSTDGNAAKEAPKEGVQATAEGKETPKAAKETSKAQEKVERAES